jgi:hypothetical protein
VDVKPPEVEGAENIKVSNIELYLGYDVASVADNTVKIHTAVDKYSCSNESEGLIPFVLYWYNKSEDNKYLGFEEGS